MNEKVCAVVITFNRINLLKEVIDGIRKQTRMPDEIIVVNNSSTDGTADWLAAQSDLTVITQENIGSSGGQYIGIKAAFDKSYDWIWTMDDDVEPLPDCLEKLIEIDDKNIIRAPLRLTAENKPYFNDSISYNLSNPFRSFWIELLSEKHLENELIRASGITFEGPLFHRSIVEKIGLPEKNFFIYADDTEFFIRAEKAGFKNFIIREAHLQRKLQVQEQNKEFSWKHYYIIRNIVAIDVLHGSKPVRYIRPFAYLISWLHRCRSFKNVRTTFKAFFDGYFYKRKTYI